MEPRPMREYWMVEREFEVGRLREEMMRVEMTEIQVERPPIRSETTPMWVEAWTLGCRAKDRGD